MAATLMTARWVVGRENDRHAVLENGEVTFDGDRIVFDGHRFQGEVAPHRLRQRAPRPGLIDLGALSDPTRPCSPSTTRLAQGPCPARELYDLREIDAAKGLGSTLIGNSVGITGVHVWTPDSILMP